MFLSDLNIGVFGKEWGIRIRMHDNGLAVCDNTKFTPTSQMVLSKCIPIINTGIRPHCFWAEGGYWS